MLKTTLAGAHNLNIESNCMEKEGLVKMSDQYGKTLLGSRGGWDTGLYGCQILHCNHALG